MTRKIKVGYIKERCIGNASCAALAPDQFEFEGQKATLVNGKDEGDGKFYLDVSCDDSEADDIIEAAKACPVNAIGVFDKEKNEEIVGLEVKQDEAKEVKAEYDDAKEFVMDKGYFLIRLDREKKNIEVAYCDEKNKVVLKVTGNKPIDIYQTIINKESLPLRKDHAAYLGRELQKAYTALQNNLEYVQDDELDLNKKVS
jgi:ferredoxin